MRAGDRLGTVDVLGVSQEVVSPIDGIVGASLVEPGDPVEYGQEVMEIELLGAPLAPMPAPGASVDAAVVADAAAPDRPPEAG